MAYSLPSFCSLNLPFCRHKILIKHTQVRSQLFRDEGKSANIVDGNLSILKDRIQKVKTMERLEACLMMKNGWNYGNSYDDDKHKRHAFACESLELIGLTSGTIGLVFLFGTLCISLVSLIVKLGG
ncbi:hypothetical protein UlMin_040771 [Ulmus minor]